MLIYREKNLEVAKKEAKAKEKKNEEKQAASKDDVEIDHEERMQEVCFNVVDLSFCGESYHLNSGRKRLLCCRRGCRTMKYMKFLLLKAIKIVLLLLQNAT